ncbi:14606_t:CDS:2 [Acaulospora morrowiae]|uniref:14606_t:CDS:1 n=1 Tax=Acaulospora morrowiae TaxID=94023 RepID=A0A9N9B124_9GLOM|nr:14606_t:CDS:2 [Acaulospora morrowiae]
MNNSSKDKTETTYNNLDSTSSIIPHIQVIPAKREAESWVWSYIQKKTRRCQVLVEKDGVKHQCEWFCQKKTSTTSIAGHLRMKHRIIEGKEDIETEIVSKQDDNFFLDPYKRERITNCLLAWLIDDMQAFHVVNNSKFQELFYEAVPQYSVPCKNSLYKKMSEAVSIGEKKLDKLMADSMETFFFTTDLWTQHHISYIGVTIHWITSDFEIKQALLTIANFLYPHTGDNIEDYLRKEFQKWNITAKLFGGTTDNDSSMIKATMQLAIKDGLKNIKTLIDAAKKLKNIKTLIDAAKKLNNFISNHDKYRDLLKTTFRELNNSDLFTREINVLDPITSDTDTRWNNWIALEELILLSQPFIDATNITSGSIYPTLSLCMQ